MIKSYWSTNILYNNIKDKVLVEKALEYITSTFSCNSMPNSISEINLYEKEYQVDSIKPITNYIKEQVDKYIKLVWNIDVEKKIKVHATNHDKINSHNHSGSHLSGIFYLSVPQGNLLLYDPRHNANRGFPNLIRDKEFNITEIDVKEGDIIIFPSYVWHESTPNTFPFPRVIMPFDVYMDKD